MDIQIKKIKTKSYYSPEALRRRKVRELYPHIWAIGNLEILDKHLVGFFCSVKCPGEVILRVYDLARNLRDAGVVVIGGFHSPLEKDCLDLLMRGTQPVVISPARSIENMRIPSAWKEPLTQGRLLILSPFESKHRRLTATLAEQRNRFVAYVADQVLVAYAALGGKTQRFCSEIAAQSKPMYTLDLKENDYMTQLGFCGINVNNVAETLATT
jgi:predicted Rossmann fold nucleotide-binding protein DprA/Smf involved in DNA uptake